MVAAVNATPIFECINAPGTMESISYVLSFESTCAEHACLNSRRFLQTLGRRGQRCSPIFER
eukprot:203808-Heterocapsa_arctica.AAC.1